MARRFSTRLAPIPPAAVVAELARVAVLLGAVGLVAIGASGALAELLGRLFGATFVAGDLPGVTYTRQRCAEFLEYLPDAGGCARAAALHHWGEVVEYRVAAAVLGLLVLGAFLWWRRRRGQEPQYLGVLPDGFSATVATSLYGLAAAVPGRPSLDALPVAGGDGMGQWLSGAVVASALAILCGISLYASWSRNDLVPWRDRLTVPAAVGWSPSQIMTIGTAAVPAAEVRLASRPLRWRWWPRPWS